MLIIKHKLLESTHSFRLRGHRVQNENKSQNLLALTVYRRVSPKSLYEYANILGNVIRERTERGTDERAANGDGGIDSLFVGEGRVHLHDVKCYKQARLVYGLADVVSLAES